MSTPDAEHAIAVIGMAGRFPQAPDVEAFWSLLREGREAVTFLSDAELRHAGVSESLIGNPAYVRACVKLPDTELFDAEFFGYSPRQAANIDPQQRVFLECAWEALELAGYGGDTHRGCVGVFAGCGASMHLLGSLQRLVRAGAPQDVFQTLVDSEKDYLTTRVSYKLGLRGPSITVQTACSTSLVAVHLASQSLLSLECDLALAGGVSVRAGRRAGYLHIPGGIASADGHCRAFDADATGILAGEGAGVVVLKRLTDALQDGDHIHAVIHSTVVNNDGSDKIGYTAPGLRAQTDLVATALAIAGVAPREVGMIEAHGTGTVLGDAIELSALSEVFRGRAARTCALGSLKSNIGHLDAAAGVAGLIKAILCLEHRALVPSLNYSRPNALLLDPACPFYVNTEYRPWSVAPGERRIAGISSFGIGGTNAHVIVGEAPITSSLSPHSAAHLFPISARTPAALSMVRENLRNLLRSRPPENLADVAFTLQIGRKAFVHRQCVIANSVDTLVAALGQPRITASRNCRVVFMFPGQGAPYRGALSDLYRGEASVREDLERCVRGLAAHTTTDVRELLCQVDGGRTSGERDGPLVVQPCLFVAEWCLARLFLRWGVHPAAVIGHSLGEYAAACIAGAMSVEDALELVVTRARIVDALPRGSMFAVEGDLEALAGELPAELSIAAINSSSQCVISGATPAMERFVAKLESVGRSCRRLGVTHAFHSQMMDPGVQPLQRAAERVSISTPAIPIVLGLSGVCGTAAPDPRYWGRQLRDPVLFARGIAELTRVPDTVLLEVGPGQTLTRLLRQQLRDRDDVMLEASAKDGCRHEEFLATLGRLWDLGAPVGWTELHAQTRRRRVVLPPYPFERQPHIPEYLSAAVQLSEQAPQAAAKRRPMSQWFYLPSWKRALLPGPIVPDRARAGTWLLLHDGRDPCDAFVRQLHACDAHLITVTASSTYKEHSATSFSVDPQSPEDWRRLITTLQERGQRPRFILQCWMQSSGWVRTLNLLQALCAYSEPGTLTLLSITRALYDVVGESDADAEVAAIESLCKVASQELPWLRSAVVDLPAEAQADNERHAAWVLSEVCGGDDAPVVAYRGGSRLLQCYEPIELLDARTPSRTLRQQGTYILTGGLGKLGLAIAEYLAHRYRARLVLVTRGPFPPREHWAEYCVPGAITSPTATIVRRLVDMEAAGAQVMIASADIAALEAVGEVVEAVEQRFGKIHGVFHLAADLRHHSSARPLTQLTREDLSTQLLPKVGGFRALQQTLATRHCDFCISFSSNAAILGGLGFGAYAAANAVLDHANATASRKSGFPWITVNWDRWLPPDDSGGGGTVVPGDPHALSIPEGLEALAGIIQFATVARIAVSATPIQARMETWLTQSKRRKTVSRVTPEAGIVVDTTCSPLERTIGEVWQEVLGVERVASDADFLDLGGDSLIGLRVVGRLRELCGVAVPVGVLVTSPATVKTVARYIIDTIVADAQPGALEEALAQLET